MTLNHGERRVSLRVVADTVLAAGRFMSALNPKYEYGAQKRAASAPAATSEAVKRAKEEEVPKVSRYTRFRGL